MSHLYGLIHLVNLHNLLCQQIVTTRRNTNSYCNPYLDCRPVHDRKRTILGRIADRQAEWSLSVWYYHPTYTIVWYGTFFRRVCSIMDGTIIVYTFSSSVTIAEFGRTNLQFGCYQRMWFTVRIRQDRIYVNGSIWQRNEIDSCPEKHRRA